jgi:hypothetical protein
MGSADGWFHLIFLIVQTLNAFIVIEFMMEHFFMRIQLFTVHL